MSGASDDVLSGEGVEFLHLLAREFGAQRAELLAARQTRAQALRDGAHDIEVLSRHTRKALGKFVGDRTKRRPMIVPVVLMV